jgi:multidrug resistance efflux pump
MSKKIIISYAIILLVASCGAIIFINYSLANPVSSNVSDLKNKSEKASLAINKKADLNFEITGRIVVVSKNVGDVVEEGEILAKLDDTDALAQYSQAQANVSITQSDLVALEKNLKEQELKIKDFKSNDKKVQKAQVSLVKENINSQQARILQANDSLNIAKNQLDKYVLRAPFGGVIIRQDMAVGEIFNPNNPSIITIEAK